MNNVLQNIRKAYFSKIPSLPDKKLQLVVLTHVVPDTPELIEAISQIGHLALIIAIPYSADEGTIKKLSKYTIVRPSLDELLTPSLLNQLTLEHIDHNKKTVILEIGGYFAKGITELAEKLNDNLIGIIEDTESGHRQYELYKNNLPCPVLSVARSQLKEAEDVLVGKSCIYATETILRKAGYIFNGQTCLVLGYGKIGKSVAKALRQQNASVMIYDTDPTKKILALTEGYQSPSKEYALSHANFIFGTTGKTSIKSGDFVWLKDGAMLVSCSSKQIEFDLNFLESLYQKKEAFDNIDCYYNKDQVIYILGEGKPINFISEKCLVGPIISLIQGEMLAGISELTSMQFDCSIHQVSSETKSKVASLWLEHFCNEEEGSYKYAT